MANAYGQCESGMLCSRDLPCGSLRCHTPALNPYIAARDSVDCVFCANDPDQCHGDIDCEISAVTPSFSAHRYCTEHASLAPIRSNSSLDRGATLI